MLETERERIFLEPKTRDWPGKNEHELLRFVVSENLRRRHLDASDKTVCARRARGILAELKKQASAREKAGRGEGDSGGRGRKRPENPPQKTEEGFSSKEGTKTKPSKRDGEAMAHLAKMFDTNTQYLYDLDRIAEKAPDLRDPRPALIAWVANY